jgi:hypothetical protein
MREKKAQVTLFILIAILLVSAVLIFFLWVQPTFLDSSSVQSSLDSCITGVIEKQASALVSTAGISSENTIKYNNKNIPYVCYSETYYEGCVNQYPFLKETLEKSLATNSKDGINKCYEDALENLQKQGNTITSSSSEFELSLVPGKVQVKMQSPAISQGQTSQILLNTLVEVPLPLYEQTILATGIIQSEQENGDADTDSYNLLYPNFITTKRKLSDGTTIYSIQDKKSELNYMFASRSWAFPAGYGI